MRQTLQKCVHFEVHCLMSIFFYMSKGGQQAILEGTRGDAAPLVSKMTKLHRLCWPAIPLHPPEITNRQTTVRDWAQTNLPGRGPVTDKLLKLITFSREVQISTQFI